MNENLLYNANNVASSTCVANSVPRKRRSGGRPGQSGTSSRDGSPGVSGNEMGMSSFPLYFLCHHLLCISLSICHTTKRVMRTVASLCACASVSLSLCASPSLFLFVLDPAFLKYWAAYSQKMFRWKQGDLPLLSSLSFFFRFRLPLLLFLLLFVAFFIFFFFSLFLFLFVFLLFFSFSLFIFVCFILNQYCYFRRCCCYCHYYNYY